MSNQKFANKAAAKAAGWFSRRHRTREDRRLAMEEHAATKPPPKRSRWVPSHLGPLPGWWERYQ